MFRVSSRDVILVATAFCANAFTMGEVKSIGPFFIQFQVDLDANAQQSSLFMSLLYGAFFACGPFASMLCNRHGFRVTMLLGGLIAATGAILCSLARYMIMVHAASIMIGIGCGFSTVPAFAILGLRFKEKRSLANNIMTMGSALMAIPLSPLVQLWIDEYTWRGAMLLLGGLFLNLIPCGVIMTRESRTGERREWRISDMKILKTISFPCYMVTSGADLSAMVCVSVYLIRYTQSIGVDDYMAASLSSVIAAVDLCLRPISGYLTSLSQLGKFPIVRPYVFAAVAITQACVVLSFTFCNNIYGMVAVTIAYSICIGCRGALSVTLLSEFFGTESIVTALGLRALSLGIFSAVVPPIVGKIVDATESYKSPFYASAILSVISAIGVLVVKKTAPIQAKLGETENSQENEAPIKLKLVENEGNRKENEQDLEIVTNSKK